MLTCVTCTCYVTSWVGGMGCANVPINLRHMHMLGHVWVSPCWHHSCRMRTDVDTDVDKTLKPVNTKLHVVICFSYNQSAMLHVSSSFSLMCSCNHSKSVFCIKKRLRKKNLLIHRWGRCDVAGCQNRPYHVVLRPESTAM